VKILQTYSIEVLGREKPMLNKSWAKRDKTGMIYYKKPNSTVYFLVCKLFLLSVQIPDHFYIGFTSSDKDANQGKLYLLY